jgi:hypothetical protein
MEINTSGSHAAHTINLSSTSSAPPTTEASPPASLLPSPLSFGSSDLFVALAALDINQSKESRKMHQSSADAAAAAEDSADRQRISLMREKASDEMYAGIVSGVGKIADGGLNVAGGLKGSEAAMKTYGGLGSMAQGTSDLVSVGFKSEANVADRGIQNAEMEAKVAKRAYDRLEKEVDAAKQHEGKAAQILSDIKKAQEQCEKAALLRM